MRGLSLVAGSGGHSSSRCAGLSLSRPLLLRSTGSRHAGSVIVAHGPSCSAACGIFPDRGSNPCALHWQADSQPLCQQGSPYNNVLNFELFSQRHFIATLFIYLFIYLFIFWLCWVFGSREGFLRLRQVGATLHRGARAFHYRSPSRCGAQAPDAQAQ